MVLYLANFNQYSLKLAKQEKNKSFLLSNKKSEKLEKEFQEYMLCAALNAADYDFSVLATKEGLVKLLDDYTEKCK